MRCGDRLLLEFRTVFKAQGQLVTEMGLPRFNQEPSNKADEVHEISLVRKQQQPSRSSSGQTALSLRCPKLST